MRIDHHGEQREEEQRGLGIQAIGDETGHERTTCRAHQPIRRHVEGTCRRWTSAQGLDADIEQIGRRQPLQRVEQHDRLRHDQADTQ